jgi:hypothetical protein
VLHSAYGTAAGDFFGGSCGGAADVDGDGVPDFVAGSPGDDTTGAQAGAAFVRSGRTGALLLAIFGDAPGDRLGSSTALVGDLDGDGRSEILVGAHRADAAGVDSGLARLISGGDGSTLWTFPGAAPGDAFGLAVAGAGDVDGDGMRDLVVGGRCMLRAASTPAPWTSSRARTARRCCTSTATCPADCSATRWRARATSTATGGTT